MFPLSLIHLTCQPPFSSVRMFEMLSHTSFHYRKEIWHPGRQYFLLLSTVRRACWLFLKIAHSAVLRTLVLCRRNQGFFFFWWDANCTFCISHQWEHHFALNSYPSTFKSIKELWWHCFDIPLAPAFSYVSMRSRHKSDFASQRWNFKYLGVLSQIKNHECGCFVCSMAVLKASIGLNFEFLQGRDCILAVTLTPWCLGQCLSHSRIRD